MQLIIKQLLQFSAPQSENLEVQSIQICTFSRWQNSRHAGFSSSWSTTMMLLWSISADFAPFARALARTATNPNSFRLSAPTVTEFQEVYLFMKGASNFSLGRMPMSISVLRGLSELMFLNFLKISSIVASPSGSVRTISR